MQTGTTRSWTLPEIPHLECFRVVKFVHEYPRHSHETWSIGVVDEGTGGIWYRGSNQRGGAGEIIAINPGEVHTGYPLQKDGISYSMLYLGDELIKHILPGIRGTPMFPGVGIQDPVLASRLRGVCRALEHGGPCLAAETQLVTDLRRLFLWHARIQTDQSTAREPRRVAQIQEYLRANVRRNVSLTELANLTGLSKSYLIRSFRRFVGMPPYEWNLQLRIEEARKSLRKGISISDLAVELGFADQSHFHRRFKCVTGMTPAAYAEGHFRSRQRMPALGG
ncbi:MAG: AraC family transcriptional regulator [Candidatus Acidiferrum sp.]